MSSNPKTNYEVLLISDEDEGNFFYCVYEHRTEQAFNFFFFEEDAIRCKDFLDKGGAFNGFTPAFILKNISVPINKQLLNLKFRDYFFTVEK